ncbi:MAG TPA: phage infection protein [Terriglobia bacterium]|nr:phage infection protein [Terriglobia bacterium]
MNHVTVSLENCYGISRLEHDFNFTKSKTCAIYAANGMMKSSLARTLDDLSKSQKPSDRVYRDAITTFAVLDENGVPIPPESILVFGPYDEDLDASQRVSNLLLSKTLKREHDELTAKIEDSKTALLKALKKQAQTKLSANDIETEISFSVMRDGNQFLHALVRLRSEILKQDATPYANLRYDTIFDPKVLDFVTSQSGKDAITNYVTRYNELLAASHFFSRGIFNYYNANQISKSLTDNGFFRANHMVWLKSRGSRPDIEVKSREQLERVIEDEKSDILKDSKLTKEFDEFARRADKNKELREFINYLQDNPTWLAELENPEKFKTEVWKSYLKTHFVLYMDLIGRYESSETRLKELGAIAAAEKTRWETIVAEFKERFDVPFIVSVKNKTTCVLGEHTHAELLFKFVGGPGEVELERKPLLDVLSMGQRKAFYILNIMFDVFSRKENGRETLIVLDDISDSFDYQNKYAIVQYLQDINADSLFKQIIMTHNFDFLRTLVCRTIVPHDNCFMASKNKDGRIVFETAEGVRDMFLKVLRKGYFIDQKKAVACIPFLRNLRELHTDDLDDPDYMLLTSLLHWKPGASDKILRKDLDDVYNRIFPSEAVRSKNGHETMVDIISQEASNCIAAPEGVNFENKLIMSIAIRLRADKFMIERIDDDRFVAKIKGRQTNKLFDEFKKRFPNDNRLKVLEKVLLMTPENIHLNSFMYEPIIDMNDHHLRELYLQVCELHKAIR